jgi:hypothetical protein
MMILLAIEIGITAIIALAVSAFAIALADRGRKFFLQFGLDLIQLYAGWKQAGLDVELKQAQLDVYDRQLLKGGER